MTHGYVLPSSSIFYGSLHVRPRMTIMLPFVEFEMEMEHHFCVWKYGFFQLTLGHLLNGGEAAARDNRVVTLRLDHQILLNLHNTTLSLNEESIDLIDGVRYLLMQGSINLFANDFLDAFQR